MLCPFHCPFLVEGWAEKACLWSVFRRLAAHR